MLLLLIWLAIGGLIIGGLGRLLVPGPNRIGLIRTALVGLAGSFLGGLVARYAIGLHYRYSLLAGFILALIFTAILVPAVKHRPAARRYNIPLSPATGYPVLHPPVAPRTLRKHAPPPPPLLQP